MTHPQTEPADGCTEQHLADDDRGERARRLWQRKGAGRNRHHREAIQDQRRGVVRQSLALEDDEDAARQSELARDCQRRHHVRRRDNGAEQEADAPWQPDQIMRRGGDREPGDGDHVYAAGRKSQAGGQNGGRARWAALD